MIIYREDADFLIHRLRRRTEGGIVCSPPIQLFTKDDIVYMLQVVQAFALAVVWPIIIEDNINIGQLDIRWTRNLGRRRKCCTSWTEHGPALFGTCDTIPGARAQ